MANKKILIVAGACTLVMFTACGKESKTTSVTPTPTPEETQTVAMETETATPEEEIDEVTGVIKSFTGGNLILEDDQQESLNFELGDAKLECANGILAGDQVSIIYEGTIKGTDTSKVKVIKVIDKGERQELEEQTMVGTVTDASMNTLMVKNEDGDSINFITTGAQISCKNGLELGNWVKVTYKGEIKTGNAKNVKVISVVDDDEHIAKKQETVSVNPVTKTVYTTAPLNIRESYSTDSAIVDQVPAGQELKELGETTNGWVQVEYDGQECYAFEEYITTVKPTQVAEPTATPEVSQEEHQVNVSISDVDKNVITVETTEGKTYKFDCNNGELYLQYGLLEGSMVTVDYLGRASGDTSTSQVLAVTDATEEGDAVTTVTGTVLACGMNTLTIMSDDGAQITCNLENADIDMDGLPEEGSYVVVTIEPGSDSNVYDALDISYAY